MRPSMLLVAVSAMSFLVPAPLQAQTSTGTGSTGCAVITQAAATGAANRVTADIKTIQQPTSVTNLTCLDGILSGAGLNLITNLLDPTTLLNAIEGQICMAIKQEWNALMSGSSCGLTVTGFSLGIGGLGGGLSCPKLTFGGGGPTLATFGTGTGGSSSGLYINGTAQSPTGFSLPATPMGSF